MQGAVEEPPRNMKEGFPVEVACKRRPEVEVGWGWVKVKRGSVGRAHRQRISISGPETGEAWNVLERSGSCRKPEGPLCISEKLGLLHG